MLTSSIDVKQMENIATGNAGDRMGAGLLEQLTFCKAERELLQEKLHVHLDMWTLEKRKSQELMANVTSAHKLKAATQASQMAHANLCLGSNQQLLLAYKLKLEAAAEEQEIVEAHITASNFQFKKQLRVYMDELKKVKHDQEVSGLKQKEKIELLVKEQDILKAEIMHCNILVKELKIVKRENDKLKAESEHRHREQKLQEDGLDGERKLRARMEKELQVLLEEKDSLICKQKQWSEMQHGIDKLVAERDLLQREQRQWLATQQKMQELFGETVNVEQALELLVREKSFAWSQMKRMEEDYADRLRRTVGQLHEGRQELEKLREEVGKTKLGSTDRNVEMILKQELKQKEEEMSELRERLTKVTGCSNRVETEVRELQARVDKLKEENRILVEVAMVRDSSLSVLTSQNEALQKQLDLFTLQLHDERPGNAKEGPEVLNAEEGPNLEPDIIQSQVYQALHMEKDEQRKVLKSLDELRNENENLRFLYGELEAQYKKMQKPERLLRNVGRRDRTNRNLKAEIEAAACPSVEEDLEHSSKRARKDKKANNIREHALNDSTEKLARKRKKAEIIYSASNANATFQSNENDACSLSKETSPQKKRGQRRARGQKGSVSSPTGDPHSASNDCLRELETALENRLVNKKPRRNTKGKESEVRTPICNGKSQAVPVSDIATHTENFVSEIGASLCRGSVRKLLRRNPDEGQPSKSSQTVRVPLHPVSANQTSIVRENSGRKFSIEDMSQKQCEEKKQSKLCKASETVTSYFSASFSVPKLNQRPFSQSS